MALPWLNNAMAKPKTPTGPMPEEPPPRRPPANRAECRFVETVAYTEWVELYRPGGHYPVHLGDMLDYGRYRIIRKLGYGANSTVWLAHNTSAHSSDRSYEPFSDQKPDNHSIVAIKILKVDAPSTSETTLYDVIREAPMNRRFKDHIVRPLDRFTQHGPNGTHVCLVFPPMGPSARALIEEAKYSTESGTHAIPLEQRRRMLKDLLLGLHCLHSCRVAHGDLNLGNLLTSIRPLTNADLPELSQQPYHHNSVPVKRLDGKPDRWSPNYLFSSQPLTKFVDGSRMMQMKLADLGGSFPFDSPPRHNVTPLPLRAPEIVLQQPVDHKIDIWAFGCLVFEILTGRVLFALDGNASGENDDDHLLQMSDKLGHLPPALFNRWGRGRRYFGPNMESIRTDVGPHEVPIGELAISSPLEEMFEAEIFREDMLMQMQMGLIEVVKVLPLLRKALQYEPGLRPTTAELLEDEWIKSIDDNGHARIGW